MSQHLRKGDRDFHNIVLYRKGTIYYVLPFPCFMCLHSVEDMIAYQMTRLVSSNLNIQTVNLYYFFFLSEISELTSSEGRSELKEE